MAEKIVLDPVAVSTNRSELDITNLVDVDGPDWGDAEIESQLANQIFGSSSVDYRIPNRQIKIPLNLRTVGARSFAAVRGSLQHKAAMFQRNRGTIMRQVGSTPYYADVEKATLHLGGSWLQAYRDTDVDAVLALECIPDWYDDEIVLDSLSGTDKVISKLKLSAADAVIGGHQAGRVRIIVTDTSGHDQKGLLWGWRAYNYDSASTAALFYEAEALTPLNGATTGAQADASGSNVATITGIPTNQWVPILSTTIASGSSQMTHRGSYGVWLRCSSTTGIPSIRFMWGVGSLAVPISNPVVKLPGAGSFYAVYLGEVRLDPSPVGTHQWIGVVQIYSPNASEQFSADYLAFQPLDETAGRLTSLVNINPPPSTLIVTKSARLGSNVIRGGGAIAWTDPDAIAGGAAPYAQVDLPATTGRSDYLEATDFGFDIPGTATIKGILFTVDLGEPFWDNGGPVIMQHVFALKGGVMAPYDRGTATPLPLPQTLVNYGGANDLWGTGWTPTNINAANFGVVLAVAAPFSNDGGALVYYVTATIYYVLASGFDIASDAVVYAGGTTEVRTEGMTRSVSTGIYGPVSKQTGDLPRIPPSGLEGKPVELFVKRSRGEFDQVPDTGLDSFTVQVKYRRSFLYVG